MESSFEPQPLPLPENPPFEEPPRPDLWTYWDLVLFFVFAIGALFVCSIAAVAASFALSNFLGINAPLTEQPYMVYWSLGIQGLWWAIVFFYVYYVVSIKYRLPFLKALGFLPYRVPAAWFVALGILLAFLVGLTGHLIGAPEETPFMELLSDPDTLWLMGIFAVLLGPVTEEVAFRGFLFRPLERGMGAVAAIGLTSIVFSSLHGSQYGWSWQILLLLFTAGIAFGFVRWKTGSLWPAIIMHMAYNGIQFATLLFAEQLGIQ